MVKRYLNFALLALIIGALVACNSKPIDSLKCQVTDIVSKPLQQLEVSVYLDGTPSMQGYVTPNNTQYIRTLDAMFNMLAQNTPSTLDGETSIKPDIAYFRLGRDKQTGKPFRALGNGGQHKRAMEPAFYGGTGFPPLEVASIDAVIDASSGSAEAMTIIVTDLYEEDQYIADLVQKITQKLAQIEQGAVGLVGIRSEFDGIIYTEASRGVQQIPWTLTSYPNHPFYIIFMGRVDEVSSYTEDLEKRLEDLGFSEDTIQSVIFSPNRIHRTLPDSRRQGKADFPESIQPNMQVPAHQMAYGRLLRLRLKDEAIQPFIFRRVRNELDIPFKYSLGSIENVFHPSSLKADWEVQASAFDATQRQFSISQNPALADAVTVSDSNLEANSLDFQLTINPTQFTPPGVYFFTLNAVALPSEMDDDVLLKQWEGWSADPFDNASNQDGTRTHNLDDFLEGLSRETLARLRQTPVPLGQYCYVIQVP